MNKIKKNNVSIVKKKDNIFKLSWELVENRPDSFRCHIW